MRHTSTVKSSIPKYVLGEENSGISCLLDLAAIMLDELSYTVTIDGKSKKHLIYNITSEVSTEKIIRELLFVDDETINVSTGALMIIEIDRLCTVYDEMEDSVHTSVNRDRLYLSKRVIARGRVFEMIAYTELLTVNSGYQHYTATVRCSNLWFHCDDSVVSIMDGSPESSDYAECVVFIVKDLV